MISFITAAQKHKLYELHLKCYHLFVRKSNTGLERVCGWKTEEKRTSILFHSCRAHSTLGKDLESLIPQRCVRCLSLKLCQQEHKGSRFCTNS